MPQFLNLRPSSEVDPLRNFRFVAHFIPLGNNMTSFQEGKFAMGFMSIQGLTAQTEAIPYREGGFNTVMHQLPGQQSFGPVTFQRGVSLGAHFGWEWFRTLYDPGVTGGSTGTIGGNEAPVGGFRYMVKINVLKHPVVHSRTLTQDNPAANDNGIQVGASFTLLNAWPTSVAYSDLNAADNAVFVEQMTLVHEGLYPEKRGDIVKVAGHGHLEVGQPGGSVQGKL